MKTEYDFTTASLAVQRPLSGPPSRPSRRKTRITIYLDDEVLEAFRGDSERSGKGYQTLINAALRSRLDGARLK